MKKSNKALLIDDSEAVNRLNENLLRSLNIFSEIISFTNAKNAFEFLEETTGKDSEDLPSIIFLDLLMPEMDGFSFLDNYIELDAIINSDYKPIIVIVSDHLEFKNFDKSKRYKSFGVIDHLKKPMDTEDIEELVAEYFND
jgi:CheY-like chemotaxis protein